jgi:biopolymer transport protein ExbD
MIEFNHKKNRPVNLLPLMDVIFLILAVFFYLMLFMVRHQEIAVKLPTSSSNRTDAKVFASISLDKDNQVFVEKEQITWPELSESITSLKESNKTELVFYIAADKRSQHEYFVRILNALRRANITNVNIETSPN